MLRKSARNNYDQNLNFEFKLYSDSRE